MYCIVYHNVYTSIEHDQQFTILFILLKVSDFHFLPDMIRAGERVRTCVQENDEVSMGRAGGVERGSTSSSSL